MKKIALFTLLALSGVASKAQYVNAKPDDFADMFKKPLIVEISDTNTRQKAGAKVFPQKNIGILLQKGVEDVWKINAKYEFMDPYGVQKNFDKSDNRSVYLYLTKHPDSPKGNDIWVLNYSRGIKVKEEKPDYQIYLPSLTLRKEKVFTQFDINFILTIMQENIKHNQKTGSKLTAAEYMYLEADKFCKELKDKNLQINTSEIEKTLEEKEIRKSVKKMNYTIGDDQVIQNNLASNYDSCALIIIYPRALVTYNNNAFGQKSILYQKVVVSANNYHVIGAVGAGKRDNLLVEINGDDLKVMTTCEKK